jgi:hypothetical protein
VVFLITVQTNNIEPSAEKKGAIERRVPCVGKKFIHTVAITLSGLRIQQARTGIWQGRDGEKT